jgi:predicted PurR-regulated permease PerM
MSILFGVFALYFFSDIVSWMLIAWVLSLIGRPIVNFWGLLKVKNRKLGAIPKAALTIGVFYFVFISFILIFVPVIVNQGNNLAKVDYNSFSEKLTEFANHTGKNFFGESFDINKSPVAGKKTTPVDAQKNQYFPVSLDSLYRTQGDSSALTHIVLNIHVEKDANKSNTVDDSSLPPAEQLKTRLFHLFSPTAIMNFLSGFINLMSNFMVAFASITFMLFFFLKDEDLFENLIKTLVKNDIEQNVIKVIDRIEIMLGRYFIGILLEIVGITIYVTGMLWILGVPNALLLGFLAAILNTIPYLGPLIAGVLAAILTITGNIGLDFQLEVIPMLVKILIVFMTMQMLDNYILQPTIFSRSVAAHPLEIFIVIIVGAKLAGVSGMIIAVPVYTVIRVIAAEFFKESKIVRELTQSLDETLEE